MDRFSRTLLAAAAEAGLATITLSRHVPVLRRCIRSDEEVVFLAHCLRPDGQLSGDHLMLMTRDRLVITKQSKVLNRVRLEMDISMLEIGDVRWSADPALPGVELSFSTTETIHRFWVDARHGKQVWRFDAMLAKLFRRPTISVATLSAMARGF